MKIRKLPVHLTLFILTTVLMLVSCQKESDLDIPSYISINSISLAVNGDQGTASHKIVDAWIYTGNDLEGAFELPAYFPVLKSGLVSLNIKPGIKLNGIAETRVPYPFFETITDTRTLSRENVDSLGNLVASYKSDVVFGWMEDFEDTYFSIDTTARSSVKLVRVQEPSLAAAFPGEGNTYAAKAEIKNDSVIFECVSHDSFTFSDNLPEEKSYVFLELNYKTNCPFTVGLMIYGTQTKQQPILVINKSDDWNKIYVNLTPTISLNTDASRFRVFFSARKEAGGTDADIFIDNIKLVHF